MIDIDKAKKVFKEYISNYNLNNPKISLKFKHTLRVVDLCKEIAISLGLNKEEQRLAMIIGLLHDIGRFEQLKQYGSYDDLKTIDHADYGVTLLFEQGLIRSFIKDDRYDNFIKKAILVHNKTRIPEYYTEVEAFYTKIVRDADKIDILYLRVVSELRDERDNEGISSEVLDSLKDKSFLDRIHVKTMLDKVLLDIAFVYDLNFPYSYKKVRESNYIDAIIDNLDINTNETRKLINQIKRIVKRDLDSMKEVV